MAIAVGDQLPDVEVFTLSQDGPTVTSSGEHFKGRKVVLIGVPGAYTGTCHLKHLPGFVENADAFKAKGVDEIICVSVNDAFVQNAWKDSLGADGKITFLSDGNAEFTKAMGLDFDGSGMGLGTRSRRYALVAEDGVVKTILIEASPGEAHASSAEKIMESL